MEPAEQSGDAAAARLRRTGAGALERAHRTLPDPLCRGQHAGGELQHTGAILPRATTPDVWRRAGWRDASAADNLHTKEPTAAPSGGLRRGRTHQRFVPRNDWRSGAAFGGQYTPHPDV